jgi:hypothetical protein
MEITYASAQGRVGAGAIYLLTDMMLALVIALAVGTARMGVLEAALARAVARGRGAVRVMAMVRAVTAGGGKMPPYKLTNEGDSSGHYSGRGHGWGIGNGAGAGDGVNDCPEWYFEAVEGFGTDIGSSFSHGSGSGAGYGDGEGSGDG